MFTATGILLSYFNGVGGDQDFSYKKNPAPFGEQDSYYFKIYPSTFYFSKALPDNNNRHN